MKYSNNTYKTDFFGLEQKQPVYKDNDNKLSPEHYHTLETINKNNLPENIDSDHYKETRDSNGRIDRWLSFKAIVKLINASDIVTKNKLQYLVRRGIFNPQDGSAVKITNFNSQPMWLINVDAYLQYEQNRDQIEDNVTLDRLKKINKDNEKVFAQLGLEVV